VHTQTAGNSIKHGAYHLLQINHYSKCSRGEGREGKTTSEIENDEKERKKENELVRDEERRDV
jgi:hypothetical protein